MQINLVTSNKNKVMEFRQVLEPQIKVNHVEMSYPELRHDSNEEIAKDSANRLSLQLGKPVVVEDSGIFIEALNGFPGVCSAYIHKRIGLEGILKLMQGITNRNIFYFSAVAFAKPGQEPIVFTGRQEGTLALSIRGKFGWGHDPLFIPKGEEKTLGEMAEPKKTHRATAVKKLKEYLYEHQNC